MKQLSTISIPISYDAPALKCKAHWCDGIVFNPVYSNVKNEFSEECHGDEDGAQGVDDMIGGLNRPPDSADFAAPGCAPSDFSSLLRQKM